MKVRVGSVPAGCFITTLATGKTGVVIDHLQSLGNAGVGGVVVSFDGEKRTLHPDVLVEASKSEAPMLPR